MYIYKKKKRGAACFFIVGAALLSFVCAGIFLCSRAYINKINKKAVTEVGKVYMEGISLKTSAHLGTLFDEKFEQLETIADLVPAYEDSIEEQYEELVFRAQTKNFNYLALCSREGDIEMLYGEPIQLADPEPFFESLQNRGKKVAAGQDESGSQLAIFGICASYPMKSGQKSMAVAAALPANYINTISGSGEGEGFMHSCIIRPDGSFVASDTSEESPDYFTSLRQKYQNRPKKTTAWIRRFSAAMKKKEPFFAPLGSKENAQQIYGAPIPYSEWYLVTAFPSSAFKKTVNYLNHGWMSALISVCAVIFIIFVFFFLFFRLKARKHEEYEFFRLP